MRRNSVEQGDYSQSYIERLLRRNGIRLGEPQLRRLNWLVRRFGPPILWESSGHPAAHQGLVVVIDPPHGAGAELLRRSLHTGSVAAIPFGEDPGFDFLKSKLTDFGTVGACGIDYPHELWWGGLGWPKPDDTPVEQAPRVVSCYPAGLGESHARGLKQSLARLGLDHDIEPIDAVFDDRMFGFEKADFVARMWDRHGGPLLFVDADAVMRAPPLLPARLDCDFAVHRWNRWEISARTIYFGRSGIAAAVLRTWQDLAATYPSVWDGYLLDQAWSLTSSQMPLDTVWLPRSYHAAAGEVAGDAELHPPATILHDLPATSCDLGPDPDFADVARGARRAGRTGARDSLLVVNSPVPAESGVTVILRDIEASGARTIAASIEAVTGAFATDCGGFGRLELSLCAWKEDVRAAKEAARRANNRVIEIAPSQQLSGDLFRSFARSPAASPLRAITDRRG
jgi:hypothetical protein